MLPLVVLCSLRRGLAGVWGRLDGEVPAGGLVVAANHHSWWDGYLALLLARRLRRPLTLVMAERQLDRYPFFRRQGAIGTRELRTALRRVRAGALLVIYPEGAIGAPGPLAPLWPGASYLAARSGRPLVPVAVRVALRGSQRPEAYLRVGEAIPAAHPDAAATLAEALAASLARLDAELMGADPEGVPPGYARWLRGAASTDRRTAWGVRWWGRPDRDDG
jgi:1-acyl-sn-glycerol-3-phosphate acyltransferase